MSQGSFERSKYELNGGTLIVPVKIQPETLAFTSGGTANAAPAGNVTLSVTAYTRKPRRQYGIGCRSVTVSWDAAPPAGYEDENLTIPILVEATWAGYNVGDTATYLGQSCTIVSKSQENLT